MRLDNIREPLAQRLQQIGRFIQRQRRLSHIPQTIGPLIRDIIDIKNELEWMTYALDKLEEIFGSPSFWFGETMLVSVAKR